MNAQNIRQINELRFYYDVFQKTQKRYMDLLQTSGSERFSPKNALRRNLYQQAEFLMQNVEKYSRQADNALAEKSLKNLQNISSKIADTNKNADTTIKVPDIVYLTEFTNLLLELNRILEESLKKINSNAMFISTITNTNKQTLSDSIVELLTSLREHKIHLLKVKKEFIAPNVPDNAMLQIVSRLAALKDIPLKRVDLSELESRLAKLKSMNGGANNKYKTRKVRKTRKH